MNLTGHTYAIVAVKRLTLPSALWMARHRFFGGETPVHVWGFGAFEFHFFTYINNRAWFASALTIVGATFYGIIGLYPNMFPSIIDPRFSLTAHNASSSPLTLKIMLIVVIIFLPVVIGYQIWAYNLFKGKVTKEDLAYEEAY